jgi:signal transduction histidine kinase
VNERTGRDARCVQVLRDYLAGGGEAALHAAYELGREALDDGLGVLDMTSMLQRALTQVSDPLGGGTRNHDEVAPFLLECYSPYEMALRGVREANAALRRINEAREEEIKRLAHELHDEAGQMLAVVYLALDAVAGDVPPEARERFELVRTRLRDVEVQLRRISHEMRPLMLDDLGLVPALRFLGEGIAKRGGLEVHIEGSNAPRLPAAVETALYRVAQEALTNVVRHARATRATVRLERHEGQVALSITDDGVGFETGTLAGPRGRTGLGIVGIRTRVAPLGGILELRSVPSGGTELLIRVPQLGLEYASHPAG